MTEKKAGDRRKAKGELTRLAIIEHALTLMLRQGRDGLTARNLALDAGISKATLFHHFDSMQEIVVEALELLLSRYADMGSAETQAAGPDLALEMAQDVFANSEAYLNLFRGTFAFLDDIMANPDLKKRLRDAFRGVVAVLEQSLEDVYADAIDSQMRRGIALAFGILLDSLVLYLMVLEDREALENMWLQMTRMVSEFFGRQSNQED